MTNWKTTTGHYENSVWDKAKTACTKYLQKVATKGKTTDYTYAAASFQHIFRLGPDDQLFHSMLGQISVEEHGEGRPLLSCLVLHRGSFSIGSGFFGAAEEVGYTVDDKTKFWIDEMKRTHQYWKGR